MSKDGYNINEVPDNFSLPKNPPPAPPTTEYVGGREYVCKGDIRLGSGCRECSRCLEQLQNFETPPLLESERKELRNKIRELQNEKEQIGTVILMEVNRIINTSDCITEEQKTMLLSLIWKGRKGE